MADALRTITNPDYNHSYFLHKFKHIGNFERAALTLQNYGSNSYIQWVKKKATQQRCRCSSIRKSVQNSNTVGQTQ